MHTCNPIHTPIASQTFVSLMYGELLLYPSEYRSMVGALQYMTVTHLDITYTLNVVSQLMHDPRNTHLDCVKHIYRYLQGTFKYGSFLHSSSSISMVIATLMLIKPSIPMANVLLLDSLSSWVPILFLSMTRNNQQSQDHLQRSITYTLAEWIRHIR